MKYRTALVVDDDLLIHDILAKQLRALGVASVSTLDSAVMALTEITSDNPPDLLVCDLKIPDMDGLQLLRAIADADYQGDILMISGADQRVLTTVKQLGRSLGLRILGAMQKPIAPNDLRWKLRPREMQPSPDASVKTQILTAAELQRGLRNGQLQAYYQPKWQPSSNRVLGFEALARWNTSAGQMLLPASFIPQAEKLGIIDELTLRFLRIVFADMQKILEISPDMTMAINFSVETLQNRALPETLARFCEGYGVPADRFILEVTESRLSSEHINLLEVLARLHLQGFRLSIDDFGTGYSSLYRVKDIPFSELKIDRSFVIDALKSSSARAVIRSSLRLAEDLDMNVIAEGVETEEVRSLMQDMGCHSMQGFLFAKPGNLADNMNLLGAMSPATGAFA